MKLTTEQTKLVTWTAILGGFSLLGYLTYEIFFKKSTVQTDLAKLKQQGIIPTITDSNAEGYANQLDIIIDSEFPSTNDLLNIFGSCNNLADLLLIIEKYGTKIHFAFSYFGDYTLPEFMRLRLSQTQINQINSFLQTKNINYKF